MNNSDELKKTYATFGFIYEILTQRTRYYSDDLDAAKIAISTVREMLLKLKEDIENSQPKEVSSEQTSEETKELL